MVRIAIYIVLAVSIALSVFWLPMGTKSIPPQHASPIKNPPTIILIYADDLDCESLFDDWELDKDPDSKDPRPVRFPVLKSMADEGILFTNFHATTPVCAASRACLLSGQYAHRNAVRVNQPDDISANGFAGGFRAYRRDADFANSLQRKGFQTCLIGKYLHDGFEPNREQGESWKSICPSGWDSFRASLGANYHDFWVANGIDGSSEHIVDQFRTDYEADQVIAALDQLDPSKQGQLICWLSLAPHESTDPLGKAAERHEDLYLGSQAPILRPNAHVNGVDMPVELAGLPTEFTAAQRQMINDLWHTRLQAIKALDEGLGRIRARLKEQGRLENTIFIFSSDHGFSLGERGHIGKRMPYDNVTRVPTIVCGAGVKSGRCHELLANIDIAPTLIELVAGINATPATTEMDGRSFASLLKDPQSRLDPPRDGILLENWELEYGVDGILRPATWTSWRTPNEVYTEWATGSREFYDLTTDPRQLKNLISQTASEKIAKFSADLRAIRHVACAPIVAHLTSPTKPQSNAFRSFPQNANFIPIEFVGFAESDGGVAKVELEFLSRATGEYWTGQGWSSQRCKVESTLANSGGLITAWRYLLDTSMLPAQAKENACRELQISVSATNSQGVSSHWTAPEQIKLVTDQPETWIDSPVPATQLCRPMMLTGKVADKREIKVVRVTIFDKTANTYWNGSDWTDKVSVVDATLSKPDEKGFVQWQYDFKGRSDNWVFVGAKAVNQARAYDETMAYFELPGVLGQSPLAPKPPSELQANSDPVESPHISQRNRAKTR